MVRGEVQPVGEDVSDCRVGVCFLTVGDFVHQRGQLALGLSLRTADRPAELPTAACQRVASEIDDQLPDAPLALSQVATHGRTLRGWLDGWLDFGAPATPGGGDRCLDQER